MKNTKRENRIGGSIPFLFFTLHFEFFAGVRQF